MKLLGFVQSCIDAAVDKSNKKGTKRTDYSQCMASLSLYLKENPDADLVQVIDPEFVTGYGRFLFSGSYAKKVSDTNPEGKKISQSTLHKHFRNFRTLVRLAISEGFVPHVDVFPEAIERLSSEFQLDSDDKAPTFKRSSYQAPASHEFQAEFDKLIKEVTYDISSKNRARYAMPILIYILGLYTGGMEADELLSIAEPDDETALKVFNKRIGSNITLPERAVNVINTLNRTKPRDGYLIRRHAGWENRTIEELGNQINSKVAEYLKQKNISLFRTQSVFNDWLCFARERGMDADKITALACNPDKNGMPNLSDIRHFGNLLADDKGNFIKRWYILCSYSPKLRSEELKSQVISYLKSNDIFIKPKQDLYDPHDIQKIEKNGKITKRNNPVISRFLFVNCRLDTARKIDRFSENASLLRGLGSTTLYATVSHQALLQLAEYLRDFREDVELVGMNIPDNTDNLTEGVRVKILSGPFKGFEGTISEIVRKTKGRKEDDKEYRVEIDGFNMISKADAQLKGIEIERLREQNDK